MDGRHLGAEKGICLLHLFGKIHPVIGAGNHLVLIMLLVPDLQGRNQGADTDTGSAQVIYLINLKHGIYLAGTGQDIGHLVRGHGVQAAAKGVELD